MNIQKKESLKSFFINYREFSKKFSGRIEVEKDAIKITANTCEFETADEALKAAKELLEKLYLKLEE